MKPSTAIKTIALGIALTATQACSKGGDDNPKPEPGNKNPLEVNVSGKASDFGFEPNSLSGEPNGGGVDWTDPKTGKKYVLAYYSSGEANATVSFSTTQVLKTDPQDKSEAAAAPLQESFAFKNINTNNTLNVDFDANAKLTHTLGADKLTLVAANANTTAWAYTGNQSTANQFQSNLPAAAARLSELAEKTTNKSRYRVEIMEVK